MRSLYIQPSITPRDTKSLNKYFTDVAKYEVLSPEEEVELFAKYHAGDQNAFQKIVNSNLRFVISVAKQYGYSKLTLSDLINEGNIGLIVAAKKFDPSRGFKFISYAVWWIRQQILQAINQKETKVRMPQNKKLLLSKIRKAQVDLTQKLDRFPSVDEVADFIDEPMKKLEICMRAGQKCSSIDAYIDDDRQRSMHHVLADEVLDRPDTNLVKNESMRIKLNGLLSQLPKRNAEILARFYGVGGFTQESLDRIGDRIGLSKERIRQIKDRSLSKLRVLTKRREISTY